MFSMQSNELDHFTFGATSWSNYNCIIQIFVWTKIIRCLVLIGENLDAQIKRRIFTFESSKGKIIYQVNIANIMNEIKPENWIKKYADYFYSLTFLKVNNKEIAQDLVQDTFLSALKSLSEFRNEASEKTWLLVILNNKIKDYYKKKSTHSKTTDYLIETDESFYKQFFQSDKYSQFHWTSGASPFSWTNEAETSINSKEFEGAFEECLQKMPSRLRSIFISKFIDLKESEEICNECEISSSNYWTIIHRSKLILRSCLNNNWFNL